MVETKQRSTVKTKLIHHQLLVVGDIRTARDFYGRVVGLTEIKRPNTGRPGLWFGCLSNEIHISVREDIKDGPTGMSLHPQERRAREGRHVAFAVDGTLDEVAAHLQKQGIAYVWGKAGLPQIFCEDPAGNLIEFNTGWKSEPIP
jgi:catechol 2,3-dioxygenase-like lactoylglutathione lyase family enzyme